MGRPRKWTGAGTRGGGTRGRGQARAMLEGASYTDTQRALIHQYRDQQDALAARLADVEAMRDEMALTAAALVRATRGERAKPGRWLGLSSSQRAYAQQLAELVEAVRARAVS